MKQNWEYKKLGDVAEITDYVANGSFASLRENVSYKREKDYAVLVRLADFTNGFDETKFVYIDKHSYDFLSKSSLFGGEIIMSNVGSVGKLFICPDLGMPMSLAPNSIVVKTSYNRFYYYLLSSNYCQNQILSITSKTALPKFNKTSFKKISIPVPPLSTQSRIVSELDLLQSLIDKQKAQLKEYDTLAQSIFYDMFGDPVENEKEWEVKKFDELCAIITDGEHATPRRSESGVYLLSARNIQNHKLDLKDVDYIDTEEYNRIAKRITPQKGDVLISCSGSVGRVCIAPDIKFQMVRSVALLRLIDSVCSVFFEYLICSDYVQNQINNSKVQVAQANLFQGKIRALNAIVPPLSLQQSFADKIEAIEKQKSRISQSIAETQKLFDYTMDKYFG